MKTLYRVGLAALFASVIASTSVPVAGAAEGVHLGTLTCKTLPGKRTNLLFRSSVALQCTFQTAQGKEHYRGEVGLLGVNLSKKGEETLHFTVLGLSKNTAMGAHLLSGGYWGASVSADIEKGIGSTQFVGGFNKGFSLVPSIDTSNGTGISAGVSRMTLEAK